MVAPVLAEETVSFLWDNFDDRDPNSKPELAPNGVNMWALDGISYCMHVRIEGADGGDTLLLGQFAVRQRGFVRQRGICDGIARALAIQHFGPVQGLWQGVEAEQKQVPGGGGIGEQVERQAARFGIPKRVAIVGFARQTLGADIVAHAAAIVGLGQLEAANSEMESKKSLYRNISTLLYSSTMVAL